jgi:uncharacterized iron-regulated membrane protein
MPLRSLRSILFTIHAWMGLHICIALAVVFATGSLLTFATEIEASFYVERPQAPAATITPITLGKVYDNVRNAYPDAHVGIMRRTNVGSWIGDQTTIRTAWGENVVVWTDPSTGNVLGATPEQGFKAALRAFHDSLFTGHSLGRIAVSALAICLGGMIVTGLIVYRRFWRGLIRLPETGRGPRAWWTGLHRLLALWSLPFLLAITVTGLYYFVAAFGVIPSSTPRTTEPVKRDSLLPPDFTGAALDQALAVAHDTLPSLSVDVVVMPGNPQRGILMIGRLGEAALSLGSSAVTVDPSDFSVLGNYRANDLNTNSRLKQLAEAIHHGQWAGTASRLLWLVFGVAATGLAISGAMIYAARALRLSQPGAAGPRSGCALCRLWRGMHPLKWALPPAVAVVVALGTYRFAPINENWTLVGRIADGPLKAALWTKGALRDGRPLPLRVQLDGSQAGLASLRLDGGPVLQFTLDAVAGSGTTTIHVTPTSDRNRLILSLPGTEAKELVWVLGRPVL